MAYRILVVTEETLIIQNLKERGYDLLIARDGYSAVTLALREKPDLIIIDLKVPAGGGIGCFDTIRKSSFTSRIPVILISSLVDDALINKVRSGVAVDFLVKPFAFPDLLKKVKRMLPRKKEPPPEPPIIEITI
jgi:DNA-binding response OmpR family regulator